MKLFRKRDLITTLFILVFSAFVITAFYFILKPAKSDNVDDAQSDANLIALEPEFINDYLFENSRSIKWKEKPIKQKIEVLEITDDNN